MAPRTIIVAMDGSDHAINAFHWFCKALKRDDDKVVMVYSVEIYDAMYSAQWFNGMEINASKYAVEKIEGRRILFAITDALNATQARLGNTRR